MSHPADEILSALLDSEAIDGADSAHVEVCSACQDRLDALRAVSAAIGEPVTPPPAKVREAAVASALVETTGTSGAVRRIAMARRSRARAAATSARRMSAASAAAALLVALGVGGWLVSQASGRTDPKATGSNLVAGAADARTKSANPTGSSDRDALTGRPSAAGAGGSSEAFSSAPEVGAADAATPSWSYGYDAGEIGAFDTTEQLAAVAKRDLSQDEDVKAQHAADGSPCPMPPDSQQLWTAKVSYQGKPAAAWVRTTESGWLLEVLNVNSACAILASQAIEPSSPR